MRRDVVSIKRAALRFYVEKGRVPYNLSELSKESSTPELPKDPWGRRYGYQYLGPCELRVESLGADGRPGGDGEDRDVSPVARLPG